MATEKELSKDGQQGLRELYALYSEAKHQFADATIALTQNADSRYFDAGIKIFSAVLNAVKFDASTGRLPTFSVVAFDGSTNDSIYPPIVLNTLEQFESANLVCLTALDFPLANQFDRAFLAYPRVMLRDHETLERFFTDLVKVFTGESNPFPVLSNPQVRAYQLCRYSCRLLNTELQQIGEPLHAQIFLP